MKRLVVFFVINSFFLYSFSKGNMQFEYYNESNGFPASSVFSVFKDSRGFMYFCTNDGLVRFDSHQFVTYRHDSLNCNTISNNLVVCVSEDINGKLWVGTQNGLNLYDPVNEIFTRIKLDNKSTDNIMYNWVTDIVPCKAGGVWIASRSGLYRVIPDSLSIPWIIDKNSSQSLYINNNIKMVHYLSDSISATGLNDNELYCLYEGKNGTLWIGSDHGGNFSGALHKLLPGNNKDYPPVFQKYLHDADNPDNTIGKYLMSIYEDRYGKIWIGTWQDGLYRFSPDTEKIERFFKKKNQTNTINSNNIYSFCEDNNGNLWIATYGGSLNQIKAESVNSNNPVFVNLKDTPVEKGRTLYLNLRSLFFDEYNQLWIGSLGNGIYKTRLNNPYTVLQHDPDNINSISSNQVNYVFVDSKDNIWIATRDGILDKLVRKTNEIKHYIVKQANLQKEYDFPYITEYENSILFAFENRIYRINTETGSINDFLKEINLPDSLIRKSGAYQAIYLSENKDYLLIANSNFRILAKKNHSKYEFKVLPIPDFLTSFTDSRSNIWFSTRFDGIYSFDSLFNFNFGVIHKEPDYNSGYGFVEAPDGIIWASTSKGLLEINMDTYNYWYFDSQLGLSSNDTKSILLDDHNFIWLSTNQGLSRFNPDTKSFINLYENDGLPIINFNNRSYCKCNNGELCFGSNKGLLFFHPDSIKFNKIIPRVYVTNFEILNKEVHVNEIIDGKTVLTKNIAYTNEITLSYRSNTLQFEFAALNFLLSEKNKYAYKMEGVDRSWNYVNSDRRYTIYAGLQPGNYTFSVKASNNDKLWNNTGAKLNIIILPPWWKTWWFKALLMLSFFILVILLIRLRTFSINQRNIQLEQHVIERTNQLEIVNQELESFAYSVSHDLRAPLRAIDGFSMVLFEEYSDKIDPQGQNYLQRISAAAQRMGQLIDDILNLSRINRIEMTVQLVDLSSIVREISNNLFETQPNRNIKFIINDGIKALGDRRLLRIALENLIDNAWKYTSKQSIATIEFGTFQDKSKQVYYVRDDGAGFDMKYAQKLFAAFQRLHDINEFSGTGVGLATVQRIIHRHGGQIWAEGEVDKGATFYFTIS